MSFKSGCCEQKCCEGNRERVRTRAAGPRGGVCPVNTLWALYALCVCVFREGGQFTDKQRGALRAAPLSLKLGIFMALNGLFFFQRRARLWFLVSCIGCHPRDVLEDVHTL